MSVDLHFDAGRTDAPPGVSLFECAERLGIRVPTSCLKQGKCRECMVEVTEGMECLSGRSPEEAHLPDTFRLSCRTRIARAGGTVRCHTMRRGGMRIERRALRLPDRPHHDTIDPCVTRQDGEVLIDGRAIARAAGPVCGLAVDIGTTTVVLRLLDLVTGEVMADASFENPQRFGGADVMSRIRYDAEHRGSLLRKTLAGYLSRAIGDFPVGPESIYEMTVAGNTTMRDLFFGLDVGPIGQSPYRSVTERTARAREAAGTSLSSTPGRLRVPMHPRARVYGLPIVSGHVGADAAACMLAVDLFEEERPVALMDIGTNTELIVGNRDRIMAASCPAGPAFEGGTISCGMPALPGAIEGVRIAGDGSIACRTVDDAPPEGICGSGMVDLLGELLRTGRLNRLGRFEDGTTELLLHSDGERTVVFRERDISELAQAKGANVAGLSVVFNRYGIRFGEVSRFYLAGGFGRHIDVPSAKRIGLIPDIDESKIVQVGNAAIEGACIALLSRSKRRALEEAVARVEHCRLETDPEFFNYFVEGCQFHPVASSGGVPASGGEFEP